MQPTLTTSVSIERRTGPAMSARLKPDARILVSPTSLLIELLAEGYSFGGSCSWRSLYALRTLACVCAASRSAQYKSVRRNIRSRKARLPLEHNPRRSSVMSARVASFPPGVVASSSRQRDEAACRHPFDARREIKSGLANWIDRKSGVKQYRDHELCGCDWPQNQILDALGLRESNIA